MNVAELRRHDGSPVASLAQAMNRSPTALRSRSPVAACSAMHLDGSVECWSEFVSGSEGVTGGEANQDSCDPVGACRRWSATSLFDGRQAATLLVRLSSHRVGWPVS